MSNRAGQVATCRSRQEMLSWAGRVGQVASDRSRRAGRAEQVAPSSSRPERPSVKGQLMAGSAKEVARFLSMYLNI